VGGIQFMVSEVYFVAFRISTGLMQITICVSEVSGIKTMHMSVPIMQH
jgi:hypothetical protein